MSEGFWYLASPYSSPDSDVMVQRYRTAMLATAWMLRRKIWVYSPIVHCHEMAMTYWLPTDAKYWESYNHSMILASRGVMILKIDGWKESKGVTEEVQFVSGLPKPVAELVEDDNGGGWRIVSTSVL